MINYWLGKASYKEYLEQTLKKNPITQKWYGNGYFFDGKKQIFLYFRKKKVIIKKKKKKLEFIIFTGIDF